MNHQSLCLNTKGKVPCTEDGACKLLAHATTQIETPLSSTTSLFLVLPGEAGEEIDISSPLYLLQRRLQALARKVLTFCCTLLVDCILSFPSNYLQIFHPLLEPSMANLSPSSTRIMSYGCFCCTHNPSSNSQRRQAAPNTAVQSSAKHLIIMVNGIVGSASDWKFAADQLGSQFGSEVLVHCSARNSSTLTFDGVDVMGHRLAEEVKEVIEESPNLTKISFVAHSLGGVIARYAIGQLFIPPKGMSHSNGGEQATPRNVEKKETSSNVEEQETAESEPFNGTICGLKPVNFITVATPHIGSRGNWQLPFLCGFTFLEKIAVFSAHWFVGRTGKHLFLSDGKRSQPPLLRRMVSDCPEGLFISGLQAFQRRVAYANMNFDHMVGWRTSSIRRDWEIPKLKVRPLDSKYPHVIHIEDAPPESNEPSALRKPASDPIEEEMISGLRRVSWQRVDVSFSGTSQLVTSHNTIQVKYFPMHSEGADVIAHMIDNFAL